MRETLTEEPVERSWRACKGRDRSVVAHGPHRLFALEGHGSDDHLHLFTRIAEAALQAHQLVLVQRGHWGRRRLKQNVVDQLRVRRKIVKVAIELFAFDKAAALQIEQDHLSWTKASAANDRVGVDICQADFGAGDHQPGIGNDKAARAETVAIERRADKTAVREDQRRRAVPGLHDVGVIAMECGFLDADGRRQHHTHRFRDVAVVVREQLGHFVETHRVRCFTREQRIALAGQKSAAGIDVRAVTPDGVDFAIVGHHAERLRAVPGRQNIGGIPLMKHREVRGVLRALKVEIEVAEGASGRKRLVDERAGGERADVRLRSAAFKSLTGKEEPALEFVRVAAEIVGGGDQRLTNDGKGSRSDFAQHLARDGNVAPAQPLEAVRVDAGLETLRVALSLVFVLGEK